MQNRYSMILSLIIVALCPHARGDVGVTNIVQLHAPMLLHSDGTAYTPAELKIFGQESGASVAYADGVSNLRTPTGQLAQCSGPDCTEQPLGFLPGSALLIGSTLRSAELDRLHMDTLMRPDAYHYARNDLYLKEEGDGAPYGTFSQTSSALTLRFRPVAADTITFTFGLQQYLHAFYEADTLPGSYVQNDTRLSFELYDLDAHSTLLYYLPPALNYVVRLDGSGPLKVEQDGAMQYFSVQSGLLQPGRAYELTFNQLSYSQGMIASAVPEPSTLLMYLGGLICLIVPWARRKVPGAKHLLASLVLILPGAASAADGTSAVAGLDLNGLRLLHGDGTRFEWSDFATGAGISHYGTAWTAANGDSDVSGINSSPHAARQLLHACTGENCPASAFPGALTGNTADVSLQTWQMSNFVAADSYQRTQVTASAISQPSRAEIKTHLQMWNFKFMSPGSMTVEFDARAFGLIDGNASTTIGFRAWLKDNWTGNVVSFAPDALNLRLNAGDADYDSGLQTFSFNVPSVYPGPGYFLVIEQSLIATAVPEPAPFVMYGAGMLGLLALAGRRRSLALRR